MLQFQGPGIVYADSVSHCHGPHKNNGALPAMISQNEKRTFIVQDMLILQNKAAGQSLFAALQT